MGHKRKARVYALQALYMFETVNACTGDLLSFDWVEKELPEDVSQFAAALIEGSIQKIGYIDNLIKRYSRNWRFERLINVDKSILRISIYALIFMPEIPIPVTINEGIELGKIYGGEGSGQFINGVLDAIKKGELKERTI